MPASQLETQEEDEEDTQRTEAAELEAQLASGAANLDINAGDDEPITAERLATFRGALGQLLNTDLFDDDSADVSEVIEAVNGRLGRRDVFSREEAIKALKRMDAANQIM